MSLDENLVQAFADQFLHGLSFLKGKQFQLVKDFGIEAEVDKAALSPGIYVELLVCFAAIAWLAHLLLPWRPWSTKEFSSPEGNEQICPT